MKQLIEQKFFEQDERVVHAINSVESWSENMNQNEFNVAKKMISHFSYYSKKNVNEKLCNIVEKAKVITNDHTFEETIFTPILSQNNKYNSSDRIFGELTLLTGVPNYNLIKDLAKFNPTFLSNVKNVILLDDFSGSGKTIVDYLGVHQKYLSGKKIFIYLIHVSQKAIDVINKYSNEIKLEIIINYEAIDLNLFSNKEFVKDDITAINSISEKKQIRKDSAFGYKQTGSLVAFYENTPNNTISMFWKETKKNKPIFPRRHYEKPAFMTGVNGLREQKKEKKVYNYLSKVKEVENNE